MRVVLNGGERALEEGATLAQAAALVAVRPEDPGVAAAVDGVIVPVACWTQTPVRDGARIEVVRAAAGG